ncbi:ABC transporter permease subunit [Lachnospiraceae bacterium DSM 108991]|uniref:ABC transporter permease subunit n=1 Tax=Claveliimonas monacensis TaxID=2779351 RepID=A0ABR9RLQ6_9FIRM|nr:ABC transporter permease subunit [Claveliimonas monacensis]MBE5063828.1 ABC transporter permease subunit [Claveliimonas monacensis]
MLNLIRSDIFKLRKAKYFWILLFINILLAVGTVYLLDFTYKLAGDSMEAQLTQEQAALDDAGMNVSVEGIPTGHDQLSASGQLLTFFAGNTTLLMAVLISLFVGSEFNNGTVKIIASRNYSRLKIYLSKLFVGILASVLFTLVFVLAATMTATALWGFGDVSGSYASQLLLKGALELLLGASYVSLFVMFSFLIRQNGGSLAANICFLEFTSLVVTLGEMLIHHFLGRTVTLSDYLPDMCMTALTQNPDRNTLLRAALVGVCFLLVPTLVGAANFRKRDIK